MAQQRPQTLVEFSKISGVGSHKLAQYGGRSSLKFRLTAKSRAVDANKCLNFYTAFPSETQLLTLQLRGLSVEEIAQKRF